MPEDEQKYKVRFADETKKEFRKVGHAARVDILSSVEKKLTTKPDEYGEPLVRELAGYRKLPVGQWRVVYYVDKGQILVLVLADSPWAAGFRSRSVAILGGNPIPSMQKIAMQAVQPHQPHQPLAAADRL